MVSIREAIERGDLTAFEEVLAPDIVWIGLWRGQLCRNRDEVLEMLEHPDREAALAAMEPPW